MRLRIIESVKNSRALRLAATVLISAGLFTDAACNRGDHPQQVSQVAPDFTVHDANHTVNLKDYRGKTVVLNFWATWCAPCLDELPSLQALQKQMPQVQVLAVSIDADPDAYQAFLKQYDISLLAIRDGSQGANLRFGSVKVPETFVIDRNGIVRRKFIGATEWTSPEVLQYLAKV